MSDSAQFQLKFSGACITAVYCSGERQQLPERCRERSKLLAGLSAGEHASAETPAPCPEEGFRGWVDLVNGNRSHTAQELVSALKAADVLIDDEGIAEASGILADRYLAPGFVAAKPFQQTGGKRKADRTDAETCSDNAAKILECLPQHLHAAVLRATHAVLDVLDVISLVPPVAAPLALRACCSSIDGDSSLELSCRDIERCSIFQAAVEAASTLSHLQHLSIELDMSRNWKLLFPDNDDESDEEEREWVLRRAREDAAIEKQRRVDELQRDACMRHVVDALHNISTLRSLELVRFFVHSCSTADAVAKWISSATALTKLQLSGCSQLQHPDLQYPFAQCLLSLTRLQCLTLEETRISRDTPASNGVGKGEADGGSKSEHQETASIAGSDDETFEADLLPLGEVVHALSSLTALAMSSCSIDPYSNELAALAQRGTLLSRIQVLSVDNTCCGDCVWRGKHLLHQLLSCMPSLRALHLAASNFENLDFDFSANSELRVLDLRCNSLEGWIPAGTSSLGTLSALYLGGNHISSAGVESLASHLTALTSLQSLSFGDDDGLRRFEMNACEEDGNFLGDAGAAVLAKHLSKLVCLTQLELRHCELGDAGICDLASSLHRAPCLRALNVERNPFGAAGMEALAKGLPRCPALRNFALGRPCEQRLDSMLTAQVAPAMVEVIGACGHLSEMCLGLFGLREPEENGPVVFSALGHLTALKSLKLIFSEYIIAGLSELTRLAGLEQLCLRHIWVRSDVPWEDSGGKDWEQVLAACSRLTRLEFDGFVCEDEVPDSDDCEPDSGGFRFQYIPEPPPMDIIDRMAQAISRAPSLKEVVLRDRLWPRSCTWQERLARVLPQMQSLTKLSFPVNAIDLQPCMMRAAAVASMRRGETVTVAAAGLTRDSV